VGHLAASILGGWMCSTGHACIDHSSACAAAGAEMAFNRNHKEDAEQ
jgi:hypothetical protein